jgi:tryptophan synthase alpha chain
MSKVADAFKTGKAFIAYVMAGDPNLEKTASYLKLLEKAGVSLIEVGIPFSDPIAEGVVIEQASARALASKTTIDKIFKTLQETKIKVPLALMTYINPVLNYGYENFFSQCEKVGVSGVIVPDLPFEEQDEIVDIANKYAVETITLIAPTSQERIAKLARQAKGFIYLVSSLGVTGVRKEITTPLKAIIEQIKSVSSIPVAVGFGISTPAQVAQISSYADGVIVGSAIVKLIEKGDDGQLFDYVKELVDSLQK